MPLYSFGLEGYIPYLLYGGAIVAFLLSVFRRPIVGLYFLVPLLPLQTIRYRIEGMPLGSSLVYIILLGVALGLLRRGESILPGTPWTRLLCAYVGFTFVSLWIGSFVLGLPLPLSTGDRRVSDWCAFVTMPALFFLVAAAVKDVRQMKLLLALMCLSMFMLDRAYWNAVSGRDYSTYSEDFHRDGSAMGYSGAQGFAAFTAQCAIFLLSLAAMERKVLLRLSYIGLAVFSVLCLMYSFSRGGYAAFLAGWLFLGIIKQRSLLVLLAVFVVVWASVVPAAVQMRVNMTYDPAAGLDHSSETRLALWEDAIELAGANVLLGTGFGTYGYLGRIGNYTDTHNVYLEVLVETGVVGLLLLLWLFGKSAWRGYLLSLRAKDPLLRGLGLGLTGWVVCAMVANAFGDRWNYLQIQGFFWVIAGLVARGWALVQQPESAGPGTAANVLQQPIGQQAPA